MIRIVLEKLKMFKIELTFVHYVYDLLGNLSRSLEILEFFVYFYKI